MAHGSAKPMPLEGPYLRLQGVCPQGGAPEPLFLPPLDGQIWPFGGYRPEGRVSDIVGFPAKSRAQQGGDRSLPRRDRIDCKRDLAGHFRNSSRVPCLQQGGSSEAISMSYDALSFVRDALAHVRGSDRAILFAIANRSSWQATGLDEAFPSLDTIASDAGLSRRTVTRHLPGLVSAGFLTVHRRGRSNGYVLNVPGAYWSEARRWEFGEGPAMKFGPVVHPRFNGAKACSADATRVTVTADQGHGDPLIISKLNDLKIMSGNFCIPLVGRPLAAEAEPPYRPSLGLPFRPAKRPTGHEH